MSKKVCEAINSINALFKVEKKGSEIDINYDNSLKAYCPIPNNLNNQECVHYEAIISSAFIALLALLKNVDDDEDVLEDDKVAEYAILWLCYKINQRTHKYRNLNEFYMKYIKAIEKYFVEENGAKAYNSYKDLINKKPNLMNMNIKIISKFYEGLQILCSIYNEDKEKNIDCTKCPQKASEFVEKYKELNGDPNVTKDSPYYQVWSTLSTDYNNLKNECISKGVKSNDIPTLPDIKTTESPVQDSAEFSTQGSEASSSSSSIASKLIPGLLTFAIPLFLGVAYKYSLFGFDKRLHRQYLREKLKKIKKKMASYV
ncbi:Plasmodium variant antigen protein Cir/Yir/Bir, putative [Plasmodium chabaudi adami]|uniref:Plasmodium variant antigen protein Cir/Yir/Bir, putative n=1 Tax=Plasmodium chabaudi adami TaxID=5826 RepID=A0A1C6X0B5_PLACE|nr:Plasmodium variant antigen protein Cir/Yir/Bir, putative [Plasmodium chabaudi adami]